TTRRTPTIPGDRAGWGRPGCAPAPARPGPEPGPRRAQRPGPGPGPGPGRLLFWAAWSLDMHDGTGQCSGNNGHGLNFGHPDAAVLAAPDGRVVATTDLLIEGRHFRRDWSGPADIGAKAAAQNLADVAAMGAVPVALLVGFAAPGDLAVAWARDLVAGLAEECARAGATVAGWDPSGHDQIV